jgi:signal transduction histidine kinase
MKELYAEVQLLVGQVLTANLFYINIFDYSTGEIVVPFCADDLNFLPERRPIGNGIAEYVMRLGHPVVLTITEIDRLCKAGEIKLSYLPRLPIQHYLGAPLTDKQGNGFGVMSLVWLEETQTFRPEDIEVFSIIAVQVSMAIERQRSESQLVELCQTLDEASKAKSKFLANMSHELRTPLNGIIGFSSVLKNKKFGALNGTQEEYVENIWISGQHMLSLVNDLLDLSKAEAGKIDLERSWINIKEILQGSIDLFQDKAANRQVQLSIILDDSFDSLVIFADGRRIRQILYNLIDNGIKYNKPGGTLSVTGKKVFMDAQTCAIEILVEDTGIGIKNDNLELLFKPFSQLPVINRTGLPEGTGLGLALTKHLVELQGGEIYVESEFGKGSRFIVLIPLRVKQADGSSEP